MPQRLSLVLLSGFAAGFLPNLPGSGLFLSAFVPFVPLMLLGLSHGYRPALQAGGVAILVSLILAAERGAFNMAMFVVMPVCVLLNRLLRCHVNGNGVKQWYPTSRALSEMTLVATMLFLLLTVIAGRHFPDGMQHIVQANFSADTSGMEPTAAEMMRKLTGPWSFLLFAMACWLWVLVAYVIAYLVNRLLAGKSYALRPDISLAPGGLPGWLPSLLLVFALLALLGGTNDRYTGKVAFLALLLPYFLSGMAVIHIKSLAWQPRKLWLFLIYIVLFFQFWATLFVAGAGLYMHLTEILDKRKKMG